MSRIAKGVRTLGRFSRLWLALLLLSVLLTFGAGGGTPTTTAWLVAKFGLLAFLLVSLLVALACDLRAERRRT